MKDDAGPRRAHRVAERDCAAVDVQFVFVQGAESAVEPELLAAILLVLPRGEAAEHLRGERLVDLPGVDIIQTQAVALEDRRRGVHRAEAHLRRVEPGPLGVQDSPDGAQGIFIQGRLGGEDQPCRAVGDLRAVAGRDVAVLAVEEGLELGEVLHRGVLAHAVVERVGVAVGAVERLDLAPAGGERPCLLRFYDSLMGTD